MLALGLFPTALATLMYFRLIRRLGASTFSQINYLIPVLGGLRGIWLFGEPYNWKLFGSLVLIGICLVSEIQFGIAGGGLIVIAQIREYLKES